MNLADYNLFNYYANLELSYISNKKLETLLSLYIDHYNEGPFKGTFCIEFYILLNEKLNRNEIYD